MATFDMRGQRVGHQFNAGRMSTQELAQKILDLMNQAHDDIWSKPISETYEADRQSSLLADIEKLCKEQLEH